MTRDRFAFLWRHCHVYEDENIEEEVNEDTTSDSDDISDDELLINIFENEASKYGMDENSDFSDDSSAFSDECGDGGHTILKNESRSSQK